MIGSCTNGRIQDIRQAAQIMKGRKVAKDVRCIVIPATQAIYLQAMREGLLEIFIEAGAVVSTPTCGPCLGGYMGILARENAAFPRPTGISSAVWAMWNPRCIWRVRPSRRPAP